jgi:hypothetical protein
MLHMRYHKVRMILACRGLGAHRRICWMRAILPGKYMVRIRHLAVRIMLAWRRRGTYLRSSLQHRKSAAESKKAEVPAARYQSSHCRASGQFKRHSPDALLHCRHEKLPNSIKCPQLHAKYEECTEDNTPPVPQIGKDGHLDLCSTPT